MSNKKEKYEWTFENPPVYTLPMVKSLSGLFPTISWLIKTLDTFIDIISNVTQYTNLVFENPNYDKEIKKIRTDADKLRKDYESDNYEAFDYESKYNRLIELSKRFNKFIRSLDFKLSKYAPNSSSNDTTEFGLKKYDDIFQTIDIPMVAKRVHDDSLFSYWRVGGHNPIVIKGISSIPRNFPITDEQYKKVILGDDINSALTEKRLYIVDYKENGIMSAEAGFTKPTGHGYSYSPIALYVVDKVTHKLRPVAIQCGQDPSDNNLFFPSTNGDINWGWECAKLVIQCADESNHEMFSHLGYTHFISEVFSTATLRNLPEGHPLYRLLTTHFDGSNFINWGATVGLVGVQQFVDTLFAADLNNILSEVLTQRFNFHFFDKMLPNDLKIRKVDDTSALKEYPYRDDGLLIWEAIFDWVKSYLQQYYLSINSILSDQYITNWFDDIIKNGAINGFRKADNYEEFINIITMVIFTASAQHAAVNFTQPDWLRYLPSISASLAEKKPRSPNDTHSSIDWLKMIPDTDKALLKFVIYSLLGGVQYGRLGEYKENGGDGESTLDLSYVGPQLKKFQEKLVEIESIIKQRNLSRSEPYTYLLPSKIPASTNI